MGRFKQGKEGKGPKSEYGMSKELKEVRCCLLRPSYAAVTSDPKSPRRWTIIQQWFVSHSHCDVERRLGGMGPREEARPQFRLEKTEAWAQAVATGAQNSGRGHGA